MASEIRVNKIENRSGLGTVTFADTGVDLAGIVTATTFSGSGASLTALPAAQITGTLPAISGANLTNVPAANVVGVHTSLTVTNATTTGTAVVGGGVTISESGIEASGIGITCANLNGGQFGRRNKIINGAMEVAQRGTSSSSADFASVDRMKMSVTATDQLAFLQKQTSDGPDGFSKCFEFDVTTAESALDADDLVYMRYVVEAQDLVPLFNANGTGKDFILSFYVKAYQAGTYQIGIYKADSTARFITKTYTINASATWQRVEIPITGDTNTDGIVADNGIGFQISFMLGAGSNYTSGSAQTTWGGWPGNPGFAKGQAVNVLSSTDNYWRITGLQLELGSQATAFEHRSFGEELQLCRRYFQIIGPSVGEGQNSTNIQGTIQAIPFMRANPSMAIIDNSNNVGLAGVGSNSVTSIGTIYVEGESLGMGGWAEMGGSGFTPNRQYHIYGGKFSLSSEL